MIRPNVSQDIDEIAKDLHSRIQEETERLLKSQLESIGVDTNDHDRIKSECVAIYYPMHSQMIVSYKHKDQTILGVRIANSQMAIEFDIPKLTRETKKGA